ncbi:MAG TPA: sensor histidine kinase [Gaiellaceae bacterium]|nr:sensor histidine kinase [Gaiellaceae bacterium]
MRSLARRYAFDALIVVAAVELAFELVARQDSADAPTASLWFCVPAAQLLVLPLLARRRFPFAAPATVWLVGASASFVDGRLVGFSVVSSAAGMAAAVLLGNVKDELQSRLGLVIVLGGAALIVYNNPDHTAGELAFIPVLFGIGWLAGFALRERAAEAEAAKVRAAQAERERDQASRLAVAEERARIARELHDVVAHAVSVMVLQIGAVRHGLPDSEAEDREALKGVEQTGRTALTEMRRLLGAMRRDGESGELSPQAGLDDLGPLVEEVGRAGLPVRLHVEGERRPLPRALDLSAYRIVQEGLTNALKHAQAGEAEVTVRYEPDGVEIEVRDDGKGAAASDGLGHGLVGIRERVTIYGGRMSAGPAPEGGFVLKARLPVGEAR